ncbi:amino acid adenylation domain-containing protein [Nocardia sp. NPDC046763]|uniref:non-ribosomal peptide synthetase n=1 Tax=Nocardia sp. NPDC046763 TaxID=3155256 RepID=UPI0033E61CC0
MSEFAGATIPSALELSPIQRAYLVGDQDGLELRSPARYYVACDLEMSDIETLQRRLDHLVRAHPILRTGIGVDLIPIPVDAEVTIPVEVTKVDEQSFAAADAVVANEFRSDDLEFDVWPQLRVAAVCSPARTRLHLVYAMWLMDGTALTRFLRGLLVPDPQPSAGLAVTGSVLRRRDSDETYWRTVTASLPDAAELPLRPGWRQSSRAVSHRIVRLAPEFAKPLAARARAHGLTLPMVFATLYGTMLGSLGGGRSHTVTVVRSQRPARETDGALGNFGSTLPLAIPALGTEDFVALAREVQSQFLERSVHLSPSGSDITRWADPTGDRRRLAHPYAFTAVELDSAAEAAIGLRRDWNSIRMRVPQVLLDHQVGVDSDGAILLGFDWRTDAFDSGFIPDLIDRYLRTATELAGGESAWTRSPQRVFSGSRPNPGTTISGGRPAPLHERVLTTAARMPEAPAVRDAQGVLTYAMLVDAATDVAERLVTAGAVTGDRVGIHIPRGRGQVVAVLGALLAGCVYVPLDRALPDGRLDRITKRAELRFALTDGTGSVVDGWRRRGVSPLAVPTSTPARWPKSSVISQNSADTAYVIFTSGSTGEPKGVVISHVAASNTIDAVNELIGLGPTDSVLSVSSIGFDLSVYDMFGPLLAGATVVMLSEDTARAPAAWTRIITEYGITVWNSAPALAVLLGEEGAALPSLRTVLLSGDWIPLRLHERMLRVTPGVDVIGLGGATEGAIWSIAHRITVADRAGRSVPYGRPLAGQNILVLDEQRRICPDWQIGELYITGAGVADGYLNDPDKTSAAFSDDPEFGWMYRTGDRGRRSPDGVIEFLGRIDTQVKLNGYRVELGEIESLLEGMEFVLRSAACVTDDRLVGHVVLAPGAPADWQAQAIALLRNNLPQYMVPRTLGAVDEIPLTSNGKVDHQRLRAAAPADEKRDPAPETGGLHWQQVAACWTDILGTAPGTDDFFRAGGGSLDAIRLLSLCRNRFGYEVTLGGFLSNPTAAGLAELCATARSAVQSAVWSFNPRSAPDPRGRVIFFPPVGGGVSAYSELIRALPADLDVHVVGFDHPLTAPARPTLADLAVACHARIPGTTADSHPPCVFVGWSFGGALAIEAARSAPVRPARVIVIDTPVSAQARRCDDGEPALLAGFVHDLRRAGGVAVSVAEVHADPALRARFEVYRQNMLALREWKPARVTMPVTECRAEQDPAEPDSTAWQELSPSVRRITLDGDHFDVFAADNNTHRVQTEIEGGFQ